MAEMGHKSGSQNHSEHVQHTIRRKGVYYYRRRIPTDLVEACAFGLNKNGEPISQLKYSLKTSDPKVARTRVVIEDMEALQSFEAKRQELEEKQPEDFVHRTNLAAENMRSLESLSGPERRDLALKWFIEMERKARLAGERDVGSMPKPVRQEWLIEYGTELAILGGEDGNHGPPPDWDEVLEKRLKKEGFRVRDKNAKEFQDLKDRLKRAMVERTWRTYEALRGKPHAEQDRLFKGRGEETEMPVVGSNGGKTIEYLCQDFLDERRKEKREDKKAASTLAKYEPQLRILREYFGPERPLGTIRIEDAREFVEFLGRVPVNASKRYPGQTLKKASALESKEQQPKFLAPKTQSDVLNGVSSLFKYGWELGWISSNPFSGRIVRSRLPAVEKRDKPMLTPEEMSALFSSTPFLKERNSETNRHRGDARFWVPLLCLFHGFRSNEVCQLLVADVKRKDGVDFLHLRETDDEGERLKRFKTSASRREVPLHREIVKIGFLDFVRRRREEGGAFLFPSLEPNSLGSRADAVGKWFGHLRKKIVVDLPDIRGAKGLHSFRHSFVRACRDAGIPQNELWALGGWTEGRNLNSEAEYGSGFGLKHLKESIDRVNYPDVDFSPLYPEDIS